MWDTKSVGVRALCAVLVVTTFLNGCSSLGPMKQPDRPLTPEEQKLYDQSRDFDQTIAEGLISGAILGGLVGAGIGALANSKNRGKGAAVGAGIGAASGALLGTGGALYYANKKEKYAKEEDALDAVLADLKTQNGKLEELVSTTRTVVASDMQKLDEVKADLDAKKISAAEAQRRLEGVSQNEKLLQNTIASLKERRDEWKEVATQARADVEGKGEQNGNGSKGQAPKPPGDNQLQAAKLGDIDVEIGRVEQQIALMENELSVLTARRSSVVG